MVEETDWEHSVVFPENSEQKLMQNEFLQEDIRATFGAVESK